MLFYHYFFFLLHHHDNKNLFIHIRVIPLAKNIHHVSKLKIIVITTIHNNNDRLAE